METAALKTQADFESSLGTGNYNFTGWHFGETIVIRGDHSGKDFIFIRCKIEGNLDARAATFNDLDAREATFATYNLSGAKWADHTSPSAYLAQNFERSEHGYVVYKAFNDNYPPNPNWIIEAGSVLEEICMVFPTQDCAAGINVAPLKWVKEHTTSRPIWKCLIRWEWLPDVCVPWHTDGKIRCGKLELLEIVKATEESQP